MKDLPYVQIRSRDESDFETDSFHQSLRPAIFILGVLISLLVGM